MGVLGHGVTGLGVRGLGVQVARGCRVVGFNSGFFNFSIAFQVSRVWGFRAVGLPVSGLCELTRFRVAGQSGWFAKASEITGKP